MTRDLNRLGLAKLDASQRLQVHRLVQRVLRDTMTEERAAQTLENTRNLLAAASPGDPDEQGEPDRQREMGPHLEPADMIHAGNLDARQAVLDHIRFLYTEGDYENSRLLAERAVAVWEQDTWHEKLGPDGQYTLLARGHVANATRTLGDSRVAAELTRDTYDRFRHNPLLGPRHDFTLILGNQVFADLRIAGRYAEALAYEKESVEQHMQVFGPAHTYTLRALQNFAVDHRMIGNFAEALRIDQDIVQHWRDVGGVDNRELEGHMNIARDLYGLGAYQAGLAVLEEWQGELHRRLGVRERRVLLAGRTLGVLQRKAGRLAEAVRTIRDNYKLTFDRFEQHHEYSVAAAMSLANALREVGDTAEAMSLMIGVLDRYQNNFGPQHPLTLAAMVNKAIVHRALGELDHARALDETAFRDLAEVLGPHHPYALCAGGSLATDHALQGDHMAALRLSAEIVRRSRDTSGGGHPARRGGEHPYLLLREINLAHDMQATGDEKQAEAVRQEALSGLRLTLEAGHPDLVAAESDRRTEGDIEPPPT
jgi:tetratricopeptide (TPR) repeat protein